MENLMPCPFCGGTEIIVNQDANDKWERWFAECGSCFSRGPIDILDQSKEEAIKRWNIRLVKDQ